MISALFMAGLAAPAVPSCPIERAVYRLHPDPTFTAGFARQDRRKTSASDLALWLRTPKRTYWFAFTSPNGYGGTYVTPAIDPVRSTAAPEPLRARRPPRGEEPPSIEFDAFRADLSAFEHPPQAGDAAPAWLFARGLGPALWYDPVGLSGGDRTARAESMPVGLFEASGCAQE